MWDNSKIWQTVSAALWGIFLLIAGFMFSRLYNEVDTHMVYLQSLEKRMAILETQILIVIPRFDRYESKLDDIQSRLIRVEAQTRRER